ncbi:uncharacterized protein zgc:113276 isoform X4 [Nerophis ophidion]|uniref:uncharacterized protein zgc:113276 isoform X4 n=1 Tax=Nerophis ophidion TaxID=159077 RepID=UPI002AE04925|nr:uncharacterized protein zgc:113276 isoform X4 [Nerophis ophidion]
MEMLDLLIIGSGPHALTLASLLSRSHLEPGQEEPLPPASCGDPPGLDFKEEADHKTKRKDRSRWGRVHASFLVVDSYGRWTSLWSSQFSALNITHLRSHSLLHTDPFNKMALQEFALKNNRTAELHSLPEQMFILDENTFFNDTPLGKKERKRLKVTSTLHKDIFLSLPGTKLSVDFFQDQVRRYDLEKVVVAGSVTRILPVVEEAEQEDRGSAPKGGGARRVAHFQVHFQDGAMRQARRVVMATGPTRAQMANIPPWVTELEEKFPEGRLQHTVRLMHARSAGGGTGTVVCEPGHRVMVVGGGLTSAHVVAMALQRGASHVTWVMRKHLQLRQFDAGDLEGLLGRYSHLDHGVKMDARAHLRQFYQQRSLHARLAMIGQARKGGAVTPQAYMHLKPFILKGQVEVRSYCQVLDASWCYKKQEWRLHLSSGDDWTGDMIWLATGCKLDVRQDPLLSDVMSIFPIQVLDGWPCISESLQWTEGCPLYLMGQYTALQVRLLFITRWTHEVVFIICADRSPCCESGRWTSSQHEDRQRHPAASQEEEEDGRKSSECEKTD